MVRVGGGYMDMEEFIKTHFSHMSQYVMVNNTDGRAAVVLDREGGKKKGGHKGSRRGSV